MGVSVGFEEKDNILIAKLGCDEKNGNYREDFIECFDKILKRLKKDYDHLILDFEDVSYIRSAIFGLLVWLHRRVEKKHKTLTITNPHPSYVETFKLVGIDKIIKIYSTLKNATESLKK